MRLAAATLVSLVVLSACRQGSGPVVALDGRPRYPNDEGVVTQVSRQRLTLDGKRTYSLSPKLLSFSTQSLATVPIAQRQDQYVLVGTRHGVAVWVAGVAAVLRTPKPTVYYRGTVASTDSHHRVIFRDGTVLALGAGLDPRRSTTVLATIDPERHVVVSFQPES